MTEARSELATFRVSIRAWRKRRGLTQSDLAKLVADRRGGSFDHVRISRLETSNTGIFLHDALDIADALGTTVDEMACDTACPGCFGAPPRGFTCNECGEVSAP